MPKESMRIEWWDIDKVVPYDKNPRHNDASVEKVANSLQEFGWKQSLVVDSDGVLIVGHTRLKAAYLLGMEKVPVLVASDLTPAQAQAYRIADNATSDGSTWDFELLASEIDGLQVDFDMEDFGVDLSKLDFDFDIEGSASKDIVEDEVPEDAPSVVQKGDVWQLGRHRLMCGDSTDTAAIAMLMDGAKADMVFTDPPYNANYKSRGNDAILKKGIKNDNMDDEAFTHFIEKFMEQIQRNIEKGGSIYICCNWKDSYPRMYFECIKRNFNVSNCIVWNKKSAGMGWNDYRYQFEFIIYAFDTGNGHNFYGDRTQTDVWECSREARQNYVHPTQKPVEIPAKAIINSSLKDDKVLDLFGGSGSTLIACEQLGRTCYMMELDPHYCDVILERWERFTGEKAKLAVKI